MIQTGKQATRALVEITLLTGWSLRKISKKTSINRDSLQRILKGKTDNPQEKTLKALDGLLLDVREMD